MSIGGSSPLTRGKLCLEVGNLGHTRLIPAHAGKTVTASSRALALAAHPRSRGENPTSTPTYLRLAGSSPLTRGKHLLTLHAECPERLIPAHAGKTSSRRPIPSLPWAHPRSRGENRLVYWPTRTVMGSSPLTRGKRLSASLLTGRWRLIPAHAGKTPRLSRPPRKPRAHPRSRGENLAPRSPRADAAGSSPLTRGKPHREPGGNRTCRLIPAHAGKTLHPDKEAV